MKKNYLKIALVSAFAMIAGYNVYSSQEEVKLSEMALENIEALARDETSKGYSFVYYPQPGDPNYGYTKCVCSGSGNLSCC